MHRRLFVSLGLLAAFGVGSADAHSSAKRGIAVWYGDDQHGQTMANGRVFDQWAMTGASVHFPLGTRVRVTDLATRRSVTVTITDLTIPNSRVLIDLSHGAGRTLGFEMEGKTRVEVVPVGFDRHQARRRQVSSRPERELTDWPTHWL